MDVRLEIKAFNRLKSASGAELAKNQNIQKLIIKNLYYYSAPKSMKDKPKTLNEVDPKLIETYNKLGIPLNEQKEFSGVAVDTILKLKFR